MKKLLEDNIPRLKVEERSTAQGFELTGLPDAIDALINLETLDFLSNDINQIKNLSSIYYCRLPKVIVENSTYTIFTNPFNSIRIKCNAVLQGINQAIPEQNPYSISVKLPPINNLSDLSKFTSELDKTLNQAITNDYINGQVQLQNFDSGSYWYEIILGSEAALVFIGSLVWSAAVIRKKIYEGDLVKQRVRALDVKNAGLEAIEKALEDKLKQDCETEARILVEQNNLKNYDPEFLERLKHSVLTMAKLLIQGAEIHQPIIAPEEVKNLFPDYSKLELIESKTKFLPKNTDDAIST